MNMRFYKPLFCLALCLLFAQLSFGQCPTPDPTQILFGDCDAFVRVFYDNDDPDCVITNDSPHGISTGLDASGDYPIGTTTFSYFCNGDEVCEVDVVVEVGEVPCLALPSVTVALDATGLATVATETIVDVAAYGGTACPYIEEFDPEEFDLTCADKGEFTAEVTITTVDGTETVCEFIIVVEDNLPPVADADPTELGPFDCPADVPAAEALTATDNCDGAGLAGVVTETTYPAFEGDCLGNRTLIRRVWTFTDACDNESTVSTDIIINATMNPSFMEDPLPLALLPTIDCEDAPPAPADPLTVVTSCDDPLAVDAIETIEPGACPHSYTIVRTWTANDCVGNIVSHVQRIPVEDNEPPILECPENLTLECGDRLNLFIIQDWLAEAEATDNCDEEVIVTNDYEIGLPDLDCDGILGIDVLFTAYDACGNGPQECTRRIILRDIEAPVITVCPDPLELECGNVANDFLLNAWLNSAEATDNCGDPVITHDFVGGAPDVDCAAAAPIDVTFTATDVCDLTITCITTVVVTDAVDPTITCPVDLTLECGDPDMMDIIDAWLASAVGDDACGVVEITNDFVAPPAPGCPSAPVTVEFTGTDVCGLTATCEAEIYMDDTTPPVLVCPTNVTIEIDNPVDCEATLVWDPIEDAMDLCDGAIVPELTPTTTVDLGDDVAPGVYEVCYMAQDACDNISVCCFNVTVLEYQPDGLACKNVNVSLNENCEGIVTPEMVLANEEIGCVDNYEIQIWDPHGELLDNTLDDAFLGHTLNYMICLPVSNLCCWGEIKIEDKYAPVMVDCPAVYTAACNGLVTIAKPEAVENCSEYEVILINEEVELLPCDPLYTRIVRRTFIARDASGHESPVPCVQEIYLERADITAVNFPANIEVYCDANYATNDEGYPEPSVTGVPTNIDGDPFFPEIPDQLCNVLVTYEDEVVATTDCTLKIMRSWKIQEWHCVGEKTFGGVQFIKIKDQNGPLFDKPDDMTATTGYGCVASVQLPNIDASDACGAVSGYLFEYPGGSLSQNGGYVEMPVGMNPVKVTVYDDCYNQSYHEFMVMVEDHTQPVALCEQNTVVSIPNSGNVEVLAEVFDDGSWDDCGLHLFEVRRMDTLCNPMDTLWGPTVSFCCADVPLASVLVALRVTDYNGAVNTCMVNVVVQDKVTPSMTCPDDATIYCDDIYDINNLGLLFDNPDVAGNCNLDDFSEDPVADLDQCGLGTITRNFSITDDNGNVQTSCQQTITVINRTPFDGGTIVWPMNHESDECGVAGDFDPEDLPDHYNYPTYVDGTCDLLGENYTDEVYEFALGSEACLKIIRTWTVIDWCQTYDDINGNRKFKTWVREQEIKVFDTVDPVFDATTCQDTLICTFDINCQPGIVTLTPNANDTCTPLELLRWRYIIDEFNDGSDNIERDTSVAVENLPIGIHKITWIVEDRCGNAEQCDYLVEIINCKAPTPVCIQGLSIELIPMDTIGNDGIPDAKMATIWAEDFDGSSFHNCGNEIAFSFSKDVNDKFRVFDCSHADSLVLIQMWVTDLITGTQDFCETYIEVQENELSTEYPEINCPPRAQDNLSRIAGSVKTEDNERIENVMVELDGYMQSMEMTNTLGGYAFDNVIMGEDYVVDPYKNDHPLNGVSTLDLVMIQRHVLGLFDLDSPYKLIAADINNDDGISSIDLIELRKLILGVHEYFPNNESWRFVDAQHQFIDPTDPWNITFGEAYDINDIDQDMLVDFVGIKTGDVNNSVSLLNSENEISSRSVAKFRTNAIELIKGETQMIEFSLDLDRDILGLQFSLQMDNIKVLNIESDYFDVAEGSIAIINEGLATVSLYNAMAQKLSSNDVVIRIEIEALENINLNNALNIGSEITKAEIYDDQLNTMDLKLDYRDLDDNSFVLYQNMPNPWRTETEIQFELFEDSNLMFNFYNTDGKLLMQKQGNYSAGTHSMMVGSDDIGSSGVVFYEVINGKQRVNKKMIIIE